MEFTLRPWLLSDLDSLVKHANNPAVAANMTDMFPHPYTREKGLAFLEMVTAIQPTRIWTIAIDGEACGGIGIHPLTDIMRRNAELGYWLAEPFWGKNIISRAIPQAVAMGFSALPEINRIFARPFGTNKASQRALEKAGFVFETSFQNTIFKNGVFVDELFYAIRRKEGA
jgi:ribosomal-protein-alanine N-acetyltransferase